MGQVPGDHIGDFPGIRLILKGEQHFRVHFLAGQHPLFEGFHQHPLQGFHFVGVVIDVFPFRHIGFQVHPYRVHHGDYFHPGKAFHQDPHGPVGQLQQLFDFRDHPEIVQALGSRIIFFRRPLGHQQDPLSHIHGAFHRPDGTVPSHIQIDDHPGEHQDPPERQQRQSHSIGIQHLVSPSFC